MESMEEDSDAAQDDKTAAFIIKYKMKHLREMAKAVKMCESFHPNDPQFMKLVGSLIGMDPGKLRQMYLEVSHHAPELLNRGTLSSPGKSDHKLLLPPITECLKKCLHKTGIHVGKPYDMEYQNKPAEGTLFDLSGKRYSVSAQRTCCPGCGSIYSYDMYLDGSDGKYYFYEKRRDHVRVTQLTFWTRDLCRHLVETIQHSQSSFEGYAKAYTETHNSGKDLSPKLVSAAFFRFETEEELRDKDMIGFGFAKDTDLDEIYPAIDRERCRTLYPHEHAPACRDRGCDVMVTGDGVWTHHFVHCAFVQTNTVESVGLVNYPSISPNEPIRSHGEMFCEKHAKIMKSLGRTTNQSDAASAHLDANELHLQGMDAILRDVAGGILVLPMDEDPFGASKRKATDQISQGNPSSRKRKNTEKDAVPLQNLSDVIPESENVCRKNTGDGKQRPVRSRGYYFIVRAGGHVELFVPIFWAESPGQVFLISIGYLYLTLQKIPEADWPKFFYAYDNMCNLDRLLATKQALPLPAPYDVMWSKIRKVIDAFHLKNHVRHDCHAIYNPDQAKAMFPDRKSINSQSCEQTFSWLRGFKHAMFKMPKYHQLFFLHRLITRRNKYLAKTMK